MLTADSLFIALSIDIETIGDGLNDDSSLSFGLQGTQVADIANGTFYGPMDDYIHRDFNMTMKNTSVPHKDLTGSTLWVELENENKDHIDAAITGTFVFDSGDQVEVFCGQIHIGTRGESRSTGLTITMPPLTIPG